MRLSERGIAQVKLSEGFRAVVYKDTAGKETVGYGHLLTISDKNSGRFSNPISKEEADVIFREDANRAARAVEELVKVPLSQNQFDALVDFVFNFGRARFAGSTLLRKLNAGDYESVPVQLMRWNKSRNEKTGQLEPVAGLTKRREREVELWKEA